MIVYIPPISINPVRDPVDLSNTRPSLTYIHLLEASEQEVRDSERRRISNLQGLQPMLWGVDQIQKHKRKIISLQAKVHKLSIWKQTSLRRQRQKRSSQHFAGRRVYRETTGTWKEASPFSKAPREVGLKSFLGEKSAQLTEPPGGAGGLSSDPKFTQVDMYTAEA